MTAAMTVSSAMAIPARRDVVHRMVQPDGTVVELTRAGDEHAHYYQTLDKIPVIMDADGRYCYATVNAKGTAVATDVLAVNPERRTAEQIEFLSALDRDAVVKSFIKRGNMRRERSKSNQSSGVGLYAQRFPHTGSPRAIVILVEFTNSKFTVKNPREYYDNFLNGENYTDHNGTGSCREYFKSSSNGQFTPTFDVYGPVSLPNNVAYYGGNDVWGNDRRPGEMVRDACQALDATVNFADYDTDNNGYVDNVYIIYAGKGENSYGDSNTIWPHSWTISDALGSSLTYDGVKVEDYGCGNEWDDVLPTGIGTFCHEFGHVMGLPDLYNTGTSQDPDMLTPGKWSIMDYGSYNNDGRTPVSYSAFERNAMGWIDPIVLDGPSTITLENIHDTNTAAIILTQKANEFFLLENRQNTGWDTYLPGHGMIVWHIDYNTSVWNSNSPNNDATHQRVDIEEAGNLRDNEDDDKMATYPFPGTRRVTSFTDDTTPSMRTWSGQALGLPITDITEQNGKITFDVAGGFVELDAPVATASDPTGNGFTLSWDAVDKAGSYLVNVYTKDESGNAVAASIYKDYEVEGTSLRIERLQPETRYTATVTAKLRGVTSAPSDEVEITTTEATFDIFVPVVTHASNVTETGFTANWQEVKGATDYLLTVIADSDVAPLTEKVDFGTGNGIKLPAGWTSNTTDYYGTTSTNYYGESAPAIKLSKLGHYVMSPLYENDVVELSFWVRNAGNSKTNYFEVLGLLPSAGRATTDDDWQLLLTHGPISYEVKGETIKLDRSMIPAGIKQIKIVFNKIGSGNMALDDLSLTTGGQQATVLEGYNARSVGNVTSHVVGGLPAGSTQFRYSVVAVNAAGVKTLESDPMFVNLTNTGCTDIEIADGSVTIANGAIVVVADADAAVAVSDLSGRTVASTVGSGNIAVAPGFYIVTVGRVAHKVHVK